MTSPQNEIAGPRGRRMDAGSTLPHEAGAVELHRWARRERARRIGDLLAAAGLRCAALAKRGVAAIVKAASGTASAGPTKRSARPDVI